MTTGVGSGIAAQFGFKTEATYGTAITVDTFVPLVKESLHLVVERNVSKAIRAGRTVLDALDWMPGQSHVEGSVDLELGNLSVQKLFKHAFGGVVTSGSGPFVHTFTPVDTMPLGLTLQVGRPQSDGTIAPFTYAGCKIDKLSIDAKAGEIATLSFDVLGQSEATATTLATASYTAGYNPYTFVEGAVSVGGSTVAVVQEVTFEFDNNFAERYFLGSATINQPLLNDLRDITGTMTVEWGTGGPALYARYTAATQAATVLTFTDGVSILAITLNTRFDGTTPAVDSRDVLNMPVPFVAVGTTDAAACTAVITNADSSAA